MRPSQTSPFKSETHILLHWNCLCSFSTLLFSREFITIKRTMDFLYLFCLLSISSLWNISFKRAGIFFHFAHYCPLKALNSARCIVETIFPEWMKNERENEWYPSHSAYFLTQGRQPVSICCMNEEKKETPIYNFLTKWGLRYGGHFSHLASNCS